MAIKSDIELMTDATLMEYVNLTLSKIKQVKSKMMLHNKAGTTSVDSQNMMRKHQVLVSLYCKAADQMRARKLITYH